LKKEHIMKKGARRITKENKIEIFKIKIRSSCVAVCNNHLTEGVSRIQALERIHKALKRKKRAV